ncbi:MAG: hypothetical protein AAB785_02330 [Patescibacteria group bacterium]
MIGNGILGWDPFERRSDRYGSVILFASLQSDKAVTPNKVKGGYGRLIAEVNQTRQSRHIGDFVQGVAPETPEVGEKIILGEGYLRYEGVSIALVPKDHRKIPILDVGALYRAHDQTVTLFFENLPNDTQK